MAGWHEETKGGESVNFTDTYNDKAEVLVEGKSEQVQSVWSTNLVVNGDFSDGTNSWSGSSATIYAENNEGVLLARYKYGGIQQHDSNYEKYRGHVLYSRALFKTDSPDAYMVFLNDGTTQRAVYPSVLGEFVWCSAVRTISTEASVLYMKTQDARDSGWTECRIKQALTVDITEEFGAGNEPTKKQCDVLYSNWFDDKAKVSEDIVTYPPKTPKYPSSITDVNGDLVSRGKNLFEPMKRTQEGLYSVAINLKPNTYYYFNIQRLNGWDGTGQGMHYQETSVGRLFIFTYKYPTNISNCGKRRW